MLSSLLNGIRRLPAPQNALYRAQQITYSGISTGTDRVKSRLFNSALNQRKTKWIFSSNGILELHVTGRLHKAGMQVVSMAQDVLLDVVSCPTKLVKLLVE
jgi:hypothetical protein